MPRVLKLIYLGASALAFVAFLLGFYEYVIEGAEDAHFGSDVFLPIVVLVIIVALYIRRKKEMERRGSAGGKKNKGKKSLLGEKI